MKNTALSIILVAIQFACIGYFIFVNGWLAGMWYWQLVQLLAVLLGVLAIIIIKWRNLNIFPEPKDGTELIKSGPYRYIRHPMYTAVLLFCLSLLTDHISIMNVLIYTILLADLLFKLKYEEKLLTEKFPEYRTYMKTTKKIVPFIY